MLIYIINIYSEKFIPLWRHYNPFQILIIFGLRSEEKFKLRTLSCKESPKRTRFANFDIFESLEEEGRI